jgi:hypothetical protein
LNHSIQQERKREVVVAEHQRQIKEAMTAKKASAPNDMELKAMKAMGAMEEGDAVFGSGAEVHLDSQVLCSQNEKLKNNDIRNICTLSAMV